MLVLEGLLLVVDKPDDLVGGGLTFPETCLGVFDSSKYQSFK